MFNGRTNTNDNGLDELLALPTEGAPEFDGWRPPSHAAGRRAAQPAAAPDLKHAATPEQAVPHDAALLRYLRAVVENPGLASGKYTRLAHVSTRRARELRDQLAAKGHVRLHQVCLTGRGRGSIVIEPLEPAFALVGRPGAAAPPQGGGA